MVTSRHQNADQNHNLLGKAQVFGNNIDKSKLHSQRNKERIKFGKWLIPLH